MAVDAHHFFAPIKLVPKNSPCLLLPINMLVVMNQPAAVIISLAIEHVLIARQSSKLGAQNVQANTTAKLRRGIRGCDVNRVRADFIREFETILVGTAISTQAKINAQRFRKLI